MFEMVILVPPRANVSGGKPYRRRHNGPVPGKGDWVCITINGTVYHLSVNYTNYTYKDDVLIRDPEVHIQLPTHISEDIEQINALARNLQSDKGWAHWLTAAA